MDLTMKNQDELLELALNTKNSDEMLYLKHHPSMSIRRTLARNENLDDLTLETLYEDPVQNVSYIASMHPKLKLNFKKFQNLRPCVTCDKDERDLSCINCEKIEDHKF